MFSGRGLLFKKRICSQTGATLKNLLSETEATYFEKRFCSQRERERERGSFKEMTLVSERGFSFTEWNLFSKRGATLKGKITFNERICPQKQDPKTSSQREGLLLKKRSFSQRKGLLFKEETLLSGRGYFKRISSLNEGLCFKKIICFQRKGCF